MMMAIRNPITTGLNLGSFGQFLSDGLVGKSGDVGMRAWMRLLAWTSAAEEAGFRFVLDARAWPADIDPVRP